MFLFIWFLVNFLLIFSRLDLYLDSNMFLHMIIQPFFFAISGFLLGDRFSKSFNEINPHGLTGLIFFLGNFAFWMIPKSLDLTLSCGYFDKFYHIGSILSGIALRKTYANVPYFLWAGVGIKFVAMLFCFGIFYVIHNGQACASYSLMKQKEAGLFLVYFAVCLFLLHIFWIFTNFAKIKK